MHFRGVKVNRFLWLIGTLSLLVLASCSEERRTSVKSGDYPPHTAFIYSNKIIVNDAISKDEKNKLTQELENYWDDSLRARKEQRFLFWYRVKNPAVFDTVNLARSRNYMNAYLNSLGYYYGNFKDSIHIDTLDDQVRVHAFMNVSPGKNISIDSVDYQLEDSSLQAITKQRMKGSLLKTGEKYNKQVINEELDRLVKIYRNKGYYKFTREDIYAEVDSADLTLMSIILDPFRQAELIAAIDKKRLENPNWDIIIKKRTTYDSSKLTQYAVGNIYYYPETKLSDVSDSLMNDAALKESVYGNVKMRYKEGRFRYGPLKDHSFFSHGDLYNEDAYFKTMNTIGQIGAWQQVDGKIVPRDKDTLDYYFFLTPNLKQNFTVDLESSRNTGDIGTGNLFGISTNLSYRNRNVWKQAIQSVTNFRTGVELNLNLGNSNTSSNQLVQTFNISAGHTYSFPKLILPFPGWKGSKTLDNKRTILAFNAAYTDRKNYYKLKNFIGSWGYEWKKNYRRSENTWLYKPINVELYALDTLPGLDTLFLKNPFLRNSFNTGNIYSQSLSFTRTINASKGRSHFIRLGAEETGLLFGVFKNLKNDIYRYIKLEAEYKQTKNIQNR